MTTPRKGPAQPARTPRQGCLRDPLLRKWRPCHLPRPALGRTPSRRRPTRRHPRPRPSRLARGRHPRTHHLQAGPAPVHHALHEPPHRHPTTHHLHRPPPGPLDEVHNELQRNIRLAVRPTVGAVVPGLSPEHDLAVTLRPDSRRPARCDRTASRAPRRTWRSRRSIGRAACATRSGIALVPVAHGAGHPRA